MARRTWKKSTQFSVGVRGSRGRRWQWSWGTGETTATDRRAPGSVYPPHGGLNIDPRVTDGVDLLHESDFTRLARPDGPLPAGRTMRRPPESKHEVVVVSPGTLTVPSGKLIVGDSHLVLQGRRSGHIKTVLVGAHADTYPVVARIASFDDGAEVAFLELWLSGRDPANWKPAGSVKVGHGSVTLTSSEAYGLLWKLRLATRAVGAQLSAVWSALQGEENRRLRARRWTEAAVLRMTLDRHQRFDTVTASIGSSGQVDAFVGYDSDNSPAVVVLDAGILPWDIRANDTESDRAERPANPPVDEPSYEAPQPTSANEEPTEEFPVGTNSVRLTSSSASTGSWIPKPAAASRPNWPR